MRNNLLKRNPLLRLQRIEEMLGAGTPDVLALLCGRVTWIETKAAKRIPKRPATPLLGDADGLEVSQRNWHLDWTQHGGRSMIVVGIVDSPLHFALWGRLADSINQMSMIEMQHRAIVALPAPKFWDELEKHL